MSVQERRVGLQLKTKLTIFFAIYIIALSFVPLIHDSLLGQSRWLGYGTGAYQYQNQNYFVFFNDPYDGSSEPHIHVTLATPAGAYGGHLHEGCKAYVLCEIFLAEVEGRKLARESVPVEVPGMGKGSVSRLTFAET